MLIETKKKRKKREQELFDRLEEERLKREEETCKRNERLNAYYEMYKKDEDLISLLNILWNGKKEEDALKNHVGRILKAMDHPESAGYRKQDCFLLVFTNVGVMWKYEIGNERLGESVKFVEKQIAPVEDKEKLDAVAAMFANGIVEQIKNINTNKDIEVSSRLEWLYQANIPSRGLMAMRVWGPKEENDFMDSYKYAIENSKPIVPHRPLYYRGVVITIQSLAKKNLREL